MSGPFDRPDHPDEVTLWAGRLRAWPAVPTTANESVGDEESADETVIVERANSRDTVVVDRGAEDSAIANHEESGDSAEHSASLAPEPLSAADTAVSRRRSGTPDGHVREVDEATSPARRARPPAAPGEPDVTATVARTPTPSAPTGTSRRARADAAARASVPVAGAVAGAARSAHVPNGDERETYRPRLDDVARVPRSVPSPRVAGRDAARVRPRSARRGGGRALVFGVVAALVLAAAVVAFVVLVR